MKEDNIFNLIRTVELFNNKTIIAFTKAFGQNIGIGQILVLNKLDEEGPMKQSDLSKQLGYSPGGMTHIASKLIKEGYAKREYNEADRRIILLAISEEGRKVLQKAEATGKSLRKEIYEVLDNEEIEQLTNITKKMLDSFE